MPSRVRAVRQVEDTMATIGTRRPAALVLGAIALGLLLGSGALAPREAPATVRCPSNGDKMLPQGGDGDDLEVVGTCIVGAGTYTYALQTFLDTGASTVTNTGIANCGVFALELG